MVEVINVGDDAEASSQVCLCWLEGNVKSRGEGVCKSTDSSELMLSSFLRPG